MTADRSIAAFPARWLLVLVLLAVLPRTAMLWMDSDRLRTDPDAYVQLARSLADGHGYSQPGSDRATAFRPVLYPLLLAATLTIGLSPPAAVAFWNLVAGVLLVTATVLLATECRFGRRAVFVAGLLAAFDPLLLRYSSEPMTECVSAALITMSLLVMICHGQQMESTTATVRGIAAGVCLGLAALCRPVAYVTCVALTAVLWWSAFQSSERRWRMLWRATLPALIAAITVSPWILRNAMAFGRLIPATTHGGYTLLLGNNPVFYERVVSGKQSVWDGESLDQWQQSLRKEQAEEGIAAGGEIVSDRWMYDRAITSMKNEPGMALQAILLKWRRFWAVTPSAQTSHLPKTVIAGIAVWYVLIGIGLIGSFGAWIRNRDRRFVILLLWTAVASFLLIHSFYWTNTRMRAPLTGVLAVLSAVGWLWWFTVVGQVRREARN